MMIRGNDFFNAVSSFTIKMDDAFVKSWAFYETVMVIG